MLQLRLPTTEIKIPKPEQTAFNVGDWVKWKSQAQGTWIEKVGQVVAVIPANTPYWKWLRRNEFYDTQFIRRADLGSTMRKEISYLVSVPSSGKGKPYLYWPRVSALESC